MHVNGAMRTKRDYAVGKLHGLQVSAVIQINEAGDGRAVRAAHGNGSKGRILHSDAGRGKMPVGHGKGWAGRITEVMRVGSAQYARGIPGRTADVSVEGQSARRKQRFFQRKRGGHVGCAAKATGFSASNERNAGF